MTHKQRPLMYFSMKRPSTGTVESDSNNPRSILAPHNGYHFQIQIQKHPFKKKGT